MQRTGGDDDEREEDEEEVLAGGSLRRRITGVQTRFSAHSVTGSRVAVETISCSNHFSGQIVVVLGGGIKISVPQPENDSMVDNF